MAYFSETLLTDIAPEVRTELGIPADAKPITDTTEAAPVQ